MKPLQHLRQLRAQQPQLNLQQLAAMAQFQRLAAHAAEQNIPRVIVALMFTKPQHAEQREQLQQLPEERVAMDQYLVAVAVAEQLTQLATAAPMSINQQPAPIQPQLILEQQPLLFLPRAPHAQ